MRLGLIAALMVSLLSLVSCGGDDPLTEAEYRAAGNALCNEWFEELSALSVQAAGGSDEEIFNLTAEVTRVADEYTGRLLDLSTPDSLASERAAIQERIDAFDALIASEPTTDAEFAAAADAGNAISESLGNMWSSCRSR